MLRKSSLSYIIFSFIISTLLFTACTGQGEKPDREKISSLGFRYIPEGKEFPDVVFRDSRAATVKLSDYRGRVVLLNFWASWCPPCRAEMPSMEKLSAELKGYDFVMLAVNVQESREMVESFIKEFDITFPVYSDPNGDAARATGVRALPTSILIDREGRALAVATGAYEWDGESFLSMMREWTR